MKFVRIGEAASLLGVSCGTLRNWDAEGKFVPERKFASAQRLYSVQQLEELRRRKGIEGAK